MKVKLDLCLIDRADDVSSPGNIISIMELGRGRGTDRERERVSESGGWRFDHPS